MKTMLDSIDDAIYNFLARNNNIMPKRFVKFIANFYPDARIRKLYFKRMGVVMGENTYANLGMKIAINDFSEEPKIIIGNNVSIAPNVTFVAESCANNGVEINENPYIRDVATCSGIIKVEDEVWIGANVTILPNITIGRCSLIGAGSVVTKNVEPYSVCAGVPAKIIRRLKA